MLALLTGDGGGQNEKPNRKGTLGLFLGGMWRMWLSWQFNVHCPQ